MNERLEAALAYREQGLCPVPLHTPVDGKCDCRKDDCNQPGKHPRTQKWPTELPSAETVEKWWSMWPTANVGVLTGPLSGVCVLDIDPRHGGDRRLAELEAEHGALARDSVVATGGGGVHIWFADAGLHSRELGPGVELKAKGALVVAPPSLHASGRSYAWTARGAPPSPPGWLYSRNGGPELPYEVPEVIPYGVQHKTLISVAGTMRKRGLTEGEILATLREVHKRCERPGPDRNLVAMARSAAGWDPDSGPFTFTPPAEGQLGGGERPRFEVVSITEGEFEATDWLHDGYVPVGYLTSLTGAGQAGKGTYVAHLIAGLSTGGVPGAFKGKPITSLIVGDEDRLRQDWGPRIAVAGGDVSKLRSLRYVDGVPFDLVRDADLLERVIVEHGVDFVYLDQILDHVGMALNANAPRDARHSLAPLRSLADRLDIAAAYTQHPNKMRGEAHRNRAGASHQFTDVPRSGLVLGYHPDEPDRRALGRPKGNLGPVPASLSFRIAGSFVQAADGRPIEVPRITELREEPELRPEEILIDPPRDRGPSKQEQVQELVTKLGADGKWRSLDQAEDACRVLEVSGRTFSRAVEAMEREGLIELRPDESDKRKREWRKC